jgi:hypothetical protein
MKNPSDPGHARSRVWSAAISVAAVAALIATACSSSSPKASPITTHDAAAHATTSPEPASPSSAGVSEQLARARAATARYVTDLDAAKADGYKIITPMMPDMGFHFLNPAAPGFDIEKPPILVYERTGDTWQLGALEWIFPEKPASPPIDGASYGTFGAACHYEDGTFAFVGSESSCAPASPDSGAAFGFWHPPLVTMHVWLWYPNPDGLFSGTNPLVAPFNQAVLTAAPARGLRSEAWQENHGA